MNPETVVRLPLYTLLAWQSTEQSQQGLGEIARQHHHIFTPAIFTQRIFPTAFLPTLFITFYPRGGMYAVILRLNHFFLSPCDQPSAKRSLTYHHFQQQIPASITTFEPNFYDLTAGMSSPALSEKNGTLPDYSTTLCISPAIPPTRLSNGLPRLGDRD